MNNQQITKIINYYRLNHNFHSPFTFIIDGNFLKIMVEKDMNLEEKLKPLIPGKIKLKVTGCTISELEILGRDFYVVLEKAKQIGPIKCNHAFKDVTSCILDHLLKQQSVIVCSQDKILRRKLRGRKVGIMYFGPDQRVTMEDIERHQLENVKDNEKQKFLPAVNQRQQLQDYKNQQKVIQKLKRKKQQSKLASIRGVQLKYIKKNVAKGPNPLSVKKKQKKFNQKNTSNQFNTFEASDANEKPSNQAVQNHKKKRIRKRNKNKNKQDNTYNNQEEAINQ